MYDMYDIIHVIHDTVNRSHHTCDRLSVIHDTSVSCDGNTCRNTDVSASALVVPRGPRLSFLSDPTVTVPARILEDRVDCKVGVASPLYMTLTMRQPLMRATSESYMYRFANCFLSALALSSQPSRGCRGPCAVASRAQARVQQGQGAIELVTGGENSKVCVAVPCRRPRSHVMWE